MKKMVSILLGVMLVSSLGVALADEDFPEKEEKSDRSELDFIGYYLLRTDWSNIAPTVEFIKGQVVGRLFGGNTTKTSKATSRYSEQRFMPMFTYSPRLFDGWAKMRASFELDWTWGDANYGAGGNFGGAFGADFVNMQTQNLFLELNPKRNLFFTCATHLTLKRNGMPPCPSGATISTSPVRTAWGVNVKAAQGAIPCSVDFRTLPSYIHLRR